MGDYQGLSRVNYKKNSSGLENALPARSPSCYGGIAGIFNSAKPETAKGKTAIQIVSVN